VLQWLPGYQRSRLRNDLLAGAIVAALLVPQSLGYATIAGVPVQVGLYAVPLALLAYAVLGSSPQLIVGPASTVAIVSGSLVADISRDNPQDAVAITSALAITAGLVLVIAGMLRISWLAEFLSRPIVPHRVCGGPWAHRISLHPEGGLTTGRFIPRISAWMSMRRRRCDRHRTRCDDPASGHPGSGGSSSPGRSATSATALST
jgi:hypothetical protein